ncbi:MAG: hypothetical protein AAFV07_18180 [Bacteroidota bacterium]
MNRKTLINLLMILAVILVVTGVILQLVKGDQDSLLYWIGLLVYAVSEIMRQQDKAKEKQSEKLEQQQDQEGD